MSRNSVAKASSCLLGGIAGVVGVILLAISFAINSGPPPANASPDLVKFGQQNYGKILWGAWLQAVAPVLIVLFAFSLVHLARATERLAG